MTIEKYRRVIWRLEELTHGLKVVSHSHKDIRIAVMKEIGTDERTITNNINKMIELKYIKRLGRGKSNIELLVGSHDVV